MATELHPLLQEYYEETDPDKRRKCLEKYESDPAAASDPACQYRRDLYEARFTDPKKPGRIVDRFLWNLMSFSVIQKTPGLFPKHHKKEVLSAMRNMQLDERPLNEPVCEDALYRELRNAVRRFFSTCSDSSYAGGFFSAYGKSGYSFLHNIISILTLRIPGAWAAAVYFPATLYPMGLAAPLGSLLSVAICIALYRIGRKTWSLT